MPCLSAVYTRSDDTTVLTHWAYPSCELSKLRAQPIDVWGEDPTILLDARAPLSSATLS